jgi:hypothetical protein
MVRVQYDEVQHPDTSDEVVFTLEVRGVPEGVAEKVAVEMRERGIRTLAALEQEKHPDDVANPLAVSVAWDRLFE